MKRKFLLRMLNKSFDTLAHGDQRWLAHKDELLSEGELPDERATDELESSVPGGDGDLDGSYGQCVAVRRRGGKFVEIVDVQDPLSYKLEPGERGEYEILSLGATDDLSENVGGAKLVPKEAT